MAIPVVVNEDVINGYSYVIDNTGETLVRHFICRGGPNDPSLVVNAAFAAGLPRWGQADRDRPTLICNRIEPKPFAENSKTDTHVFCTFRPLETVINLTCTTRDVETKFDINNVAITVPSPYAIDDDTKRALANLPTTQAFGIVEVEWTSFIDLADLMTPFANGVNSVNWKGYPPYGVWIRLIQNRKILSVPGWRVRVELELNPQRYVEIAAWTDPQTGFVVPEIGKTIHIPSPAAITPDIEGDGWRTTMGKKVLKDFNSFPWPIGF